MKTKSGAELRIGDVVRTWYRPSNDRIVALRSDPSRWDRRIATLAASPVEMVVENNNRYEVISP